MSRSKKKQTVGWRYRVGMHMGICEGPVDALLQLRSAERVAWAGNVTANGTITVDAPTLFGGDEREGGLAGDVDVMMGGSAQTANSYLAGLQGTPQPAYRGMLGLVFRAFYWGNSPYLKPIAALVRRITAGWEGGTAWYPEKAAVLLSSSTDTVVDPLNSLAGYTLAGPAGAISADGLVIYNPTTAATSDTAATKTLQQLLAVTSVSFEVRITAANAGDAMVLCLRNRSGTPVFQFWPRVNSGDDSTQRPAVISQTSPLGSAALALGEWYRVEVGGGTITITKISDSSVLVSTTHPTADLSAIDRLQFLRDGDASPSGTQFRSLRIVGARQFEGMNPAHIVYQCMTDTDWGAGNGTGLIDDTQFRSAADTFYSEGLGLCLHWTQQDQVERFLQIVIDHAGANLVQHPRTGLFQLRPLRGGYDPSSLPLFDPSNVVALESFERPSPDEAVNECAVTYTDVVAGPGKKATIKTQNLAAIMAAGGGVISRKKDYPGFATAGLAMRAAMRDLRASSTPLAKARLKVNRAGYTLVDGDLIRLSWPKLGITTLVMRVLRVSYGGATEATMTLEVAEDVFGLPAATYAAQQPSGWEAVVAPPEAVPSRLVREANYYEAQRALGATDAQALDPTAGFVVAAGARPSAGSLDYGIRTRTGSEAFEERDRAAFAPSGTLSASMSRTATTATVNATSDGSLVTVGTYAQIDSEIIRVDAWDASTGALTLGRGVLGTVAAAHSSGARVWFIDQFLAADDTERVDGEVVDVRLAPRTGLGELDDQTTSSVTLDQLIARPYAPGRLRINALTYPTTVAAADLGITWSHRHRTQQNLEGDESTSIGPETGTTYSIETRDADTNTLIESVTGITGTAYTLNPSLVPADINMRLKLWSVRSGLDSAQQHDYVFAVTGYGGTTWNASDKDADITLSGGNLIASISASPSGSVRGNVGRDAAGDRYFEIEIGGADPQSMPGIGSSSATLSQFPGIDSNGMGYFGGDGQKYTAGTGSAYGATYGAGAIVGVQLKAGEVIFWKDGVSQGVAFTGLSGTFFPMWGGGLGGSGTRQGTLRATAADIDYLPSGSTPWGD